MIRRIFLFFLMVVILTLGCRRQTEENVLARVGDAVLTFSEARAHVDTSQKPHDAGISAYVNRWIEEEILYQEANRKGIKKSDQYQQQIKEIERQIAIQHYLQQEIYTDSGIINEEAFRRYYANHEAEFFVREDIARLNLITFSNWKSAASFAAAIKSGTLWNDAVGEALKDSASDKNIVGNENSRLYTQKTLYPIELWRVASALEPGEISFPVKTALGHSVLQIIDKVKRGSPASFDVAYDEVRTRFMIDERRNRYNDLLNRLRSNARIEISRLTERETDSAYIPSR